MSLLSGSGRFFPFGGSCRSSLPRSSWRPSLLGGFLVIFPSCGLSAVVTAPSAIFYSGCQNRMPWRPRWHEGGGKTPFFLSVRSRSGLLLDAYHLGHCLLGCAHSIIISSEVHPRLGRALALLLVEDPISGDSSGEIETRQWISVRVRREGGAVHPEETSVVSGGREVILLCRENVDSTERYSCSRGWVVAYRAHIVGFK